ncbi:hypothetical protein [Alicyclobacillus fodiniaquatilis]|uniref:Uncharacterized protein n=1 Tax=Alicyclobacillus fodiniaquatilis TaxID=1661150 RepID=A0ABW4JML3_9BACL
MPPRTVPAVLSGIVAAIAFLCSIPCATAFAAEKPSSAQKYETKLDAALQLEQVLDVKVSGTSHFADVPQKDASVIATITSPHSVTEGQVQPMMTTDSMDKFGSSDGVTASEVDAFYGNWLGVTPYNLQFAPGGSALGLANALEINSKTPLTGDLTVSQFAQMVQNLKSLQDGYSETDKNEYKLLYRPSRGTFGNNGTYNVPLNVQQKNEAAAIKYMDGVQILVSGNKMTVLLPKLTGGSANDLPQVQVWASGGKYSSDKGKTWHRMSIDGYTATGPQKYYITVEGDATKGFSLTLSYTYGSTHYAVATEGAKIQTGKVVVNSF